MKEKHYTNIQRGLQHGCISFREMTLQKSNAWARQKVNRNSTLFYTRECINVFLQWSLLDECSGFWGCHLLQKQERLASTWNYMVNNLHVLCGTVLYLITRRQDVLRERYKIAWKCCDEAKECCMYTFARLHADLVHVCAFSAGTLSP